jgi:hypothetical protein
VYPLGLGFGLFFVLAIVAAPLGLLLWALLDCLQRPDWTYRRSGQDRVVWIIVIAFVGCVGPVVYLLVARPKLAAAQRLGPHTAQWPVPPPVIGSAGWYPDPAGRHERRWYDGNRWSEHVSDQNRPGIDPI